MLTPAGGYRLTPAPIIQISNLVYNQIDSVEAMSFEPETQCFKLADICYVKAKKKNYQLQVVTSAHAKFDGLHVFESKISDNVSISSHSSG